MAGNDSKNSANRARSRAIRARMAETGENWTVAARHIAESADADRSPENLATSREPGSDADRELAAAQPAGNVLVVGEVISHANSTLAAASARIEFRLDTDIVRLERPGRRRPGPIATLARLGAKAAWERVAPRVDLARLRDTFTHQAGEGFLEPAAGRYMIDYGGYAEMLIGGRHFGGPPGGSLRARRQDHGAAKRLDDPLGMLGQLQGVTEARHVGEETLRGTPCRKVDVRAGSAKLTVWIDDEHIRRIQSEERASNEYASVSKRRTLELWDVGMPAGSLDWSRLPSFRTAG